MERKHHGVSDLYLVFSWRHFQFVYFSSPFPYEQWQKMDTINLSSYNFGPGELDLLIEEWLKDPKPKTINELARIYLIHRIKEERDFWPYDIRRSYKEKDRIIVRLRKEEELFDCVPAEVLSVTKNAYRNIGYYGDYIDVRLLSTDSKLDSQRIRTFVANYQGPGFSIPEEFKAFEIITEKDEAEVIPKILMAISNDKRFVAFEDKWLPSELLVVDVSSKLTDIEKIIEESKQALSTTDILRKVCADDDKEALNNRLEFSLNYFLSKDRMFVRVYDSVTKWNLRQISKPVQGGIEKREWTVTIKTEWLERGILIVPRRLGSHMEGTNTVHILYDRVDEVLPYEENDRLIEGFNRFYSAKAIAEGDRVHLRLQAIEPTKLFVSSRWKRRLDRLLRLEPADLFWEHSSLRDCVIVVLAKFRTPAHYREIYSEVAAHKHVSLGSIIGTLSRYCPSVFVHIDSGQWQLADGQVQPKPPNGEPTKVQKITDISNKTWNAVITIEEKDYLYELLRRLKNPLSFDEICSRLANYLKVDVNELRATGFLKADERLRRLDNGTWALEEWFRLPDRQEGPVKVEDEQTTVKETITEKTSKSRWFWLVLIVLLTLLLFCIIAMLIW